MIPIIAIKISACDGEADLVVELVSELAERGVAAGVIKYSGRGASQRLEGGAYRFASAGAAEVCVSSENGIAVFRKPGEEMTPEELVEWYFAESDLALVLGCGDAALPKILMLSDCDTDAGAVEDKDVIAVVSDGDVKCGVRVFKRSEVGALADLIVEKFPAPRLKNEVRLRVNGKTVEIKPFVQAFISNTVKGMVASLRGGKKPERVDLRIGK